MPVDPSMAVTAPQAAGAEWQIQPIAPTQPVQETGGGFGDMLGSALDSLATTQAEAAAGAQALATGTAGDPTSVVLAVEHAQLSMQLASQIRNKLVEGAQEIFRTQV